MALTINLNAFQTQSHQLKIMRKKFIIQRFIDTKTLKRIHFLRWLIDKREFANGTHENFLHLKIDRDMHKKLLKCEAKNDVSTEIGIYVIEVTCKTIQIA